MQALTGAESFGVTLMKQLALASVFALAEIGPSPLTLGGVSPEKVGGFGSILAGKLLSIAFSGSRPEAPRKSTEVDSLWLDSGRHPRCLMTTGYYAHMVPPPWAGPRWMRVRFMGNFTAPIK